jgi:asparagine synthase (glutamine-hydrolysing)
MCGIAGILQQDPGKYNQHHLKKMTDALAHRGPDGEGFWQNETHTVLFGHRRLSIIDLSEAGVQPMHYLDRYVIVHNGEIFNYIELKEKLKEKGYRFSSETDTEVLAAAFDLWKEKCVEEFDGMFAFAIWDKQEQLFFAARDRFGEKPFYYYRDEAGLLFASEIKAFWAAGINKVPNQRLLFNFITIGYTDNPEIPGETFFEDVEKLPAAHWLKYSFQKNELLIASYWDIDLQKLDKKITDEEATEKFTELLRESVSRRHRSDVALGTSLSGGIDSSAIAALSHELSLPVQSHKSFTANFQGFEKDETIPAALVAKQFGLQSFVVPVNGLGLLNEWEKLCFHQDEPAASSGIYPQFKVFERAASEGVRVLLDGQGADEILAGYHRYYKWYWQELFRKSRLHRSGEITAARALGVQESFNIKNKIAAWFPGFASIVMERQYLLKALGHEDLTREFVRSQSREAYYTPPEYFTLNGVLYFNTRTHGLEELLRYADRNSMAHGRELRLPFLSHQLVEFIFSLPGHFKIRNGWTKWLLRNSLKERLPESITWRKDKIGFEPPQKKWMEDPALQEAIRAAKKILVDEKILKPAVLNKPIQPKSAYAADNYDWRYFSAAALFK